MTSPSDKSSISKPGEREELLEALMFGAPELTFTPRGDPDPRLVRLVRFLARQAARECYEAEVRRKEARTS